MKIKIYLPVIAIILTFNSCSTGGFNLVNKDLKMKPEGIKLAVVAGHRYNKALIFSRGMYDHFKKNSRFELVPEKTVRKKLGRYPVNIHGPFELSYIGQREDFFLTDSAGLFKTYKKLNADYLYVAWIARTTIHDGKIKVAQLYHQLFRITENGLNEIGNAKNEVYWKVKGVIVIGSLTDSFDKAVIPYCDNLSKDIAGKMGLAVK